MTSNLAEIRKSRRLTTGALSERLSELGRPILANGITKIEKGARRVDSDDLVALALALNVSPLTLLLPTTCDDEPVSLTERFEVSSRTAWQWGRGERTAMDWEPGEGVELASSGADPAIVEDAYEREREFTRKQTEYLALALPENARRAEANATVRLARSLADIVSSLVVPEPGVDAAGLAARHRMAKRRLEFLRQELELVAERLPAVHPGVPIEDEPDIFTEGKKVGDRLQEHADAKDED